MAGRVYEYAGVRAGENILRWAAFFDTVSWRWSFRPADLGGFAPTFQVTIPALDCAWVSVRSDTQIDRLVTAARRDLEQGRLEGYALGLGPHPLSPDCLGAVGIYPERKWQPLTAAMAGIARPLRQLWRDTIDRLETRGGGVECGVTPEKLGGKRLPSWKDRAEAFARRWGAPEKVRDWGFVVAKIGQVDGVLAGVLAGVEKADVTEDYLTIWLPPHSIRTAILRSMGAEPRKTVERELGLQLQILTVGND